MASSPTDTFLLAVNKFCAGSTPAHPLISDADRTTCLDALEAAGMTTWNFVSAYHGGVFTQATASPSDNLAFAQLLAASRDATGAVIVVHSPMLDVFVVALASACRDRALALAGPTPGSTVSKPDPPALDKDEQDRRTTKMCYHQLETMTGKHVELTARANFVGAARNHLNADGHISHFPPPEKVTYLGVSSGPSSATVGNVTMQIGDGVQSPKCSTPEECKHRVRTMVWALGAVLCIEISPTHYGGGNDGYVLVPGGGSKKIRLAITQCALDKFCDSLLSIPAEDPTRNFATVAHIFNRFLNLYAEGNLHPVSIITQIVTQERQMFVLRGIPPPADSDGGSSTVSSVAPSDSVSNQGGVSTTVNGVCMSWLNNGSCNLQDCALNHPARMRGMAHGNGNGSGTKRRNSNSNRGGGGGWWDGNNNRNHNGGNNGNRYNNNGGGNNNNNGNGNGNRNNNNGNRGRRGGGNNNGNGGGNNNGNGGGNGGGGGGGRNRNNNGNGNGRN